MRGRETPRRPERGWRAAVLAVLGMAAATATLAAAESPEAAADAAFRESLARGAAILRSERAPEYEAARGFFIQASGARAFSPEPNYWLALLDLAERRLQTQAFKRAESAAVNAGPAQFPEVHLLLGQLCLAAGRYQRALECLARTSAILDARQRGAPAADGAARWAEARLRAFAEFNWGRLYYHRTAGADADAEARAKDLAEAEKHFRAAAGGLERLARQDPELEATRLENERYQGWCAYGLGRHAEAAGIFADVRAADPSDEGAVFWLGMCLRAEGRAREALARFEEVLQQARARGPRAPSAGMYAVESLLQAGALYFLPDTHNPARGLAYLRAFVADKTGAPPYHPYYAPVNRFLLQHADEP